MLILNVKDIDLACDCGVSRVFYDISLSLQELFSLKWVVLIVYYIWYIEFIESYYFLCVRKYIRQIYRSMYLVIRKLILMAF